MSHLGAGNRAEGFYSVEITSDKMQNNVYCLATAFALPASWLVKSSATVLGNVMKP